MSAATHTPTFTCEYNGCDKPVTHAVPLHDVHDIEIVLWCWEHVEGVIYGLDDTVTASRVAGPSRNVQHTAVTS